MNHPHFQGNTANGFTRKNLRLNLNFLLSESQDVVHWMLCEMKQMGWNDKPVSMKKQGMRIAEVGTFNKKDMALLEKYTAEQSKKISPFERREKEIVRVKAIR